MGGVIRMTVNAARSVSYIIFAFLTLNTNLLTAQTVSPSAQNVPHSKSADEDQLNVVTTAVFGSKDGILGTTPTVLNFAGSDVSTVTLTFGSRVGGSGPQAHGMDDTTMADIVNELTTLAPSLAGRKQRSTTQTQPYPQHTTPATTLTTIHETVRRKDGGSLTSSTSSTTASTVTDPGNVTNDRSSASGNQNCPKTCNCPDYVFMSNALVPILRAWAGRPMENFTDDVLRYYLHQQFMSGNGEAVTSILSRLYIFIAQDLNPQTVAFILRLNEARFGVTGCWLKNNDTFRLDAAAETRLFPQVAYKLAQERAATETSEGRSASPLTELEHDGDGGSDDDVALSGSMLYNISFHCSRGAKVIISSDVTLHRYGRWRQSQCHVVIEGEPVVHRPMSLMELDVTYGDADWIFNITWSQNANTGRGEGEKETSQNLRQDAMTSRYSPSFGSASRHSAIKGGSEKSDTHTANNPTVTLASATPFHNIVEVNLINTTLTMEALQRLLVLFYKADSLVLKNNSLDDFNCSQLLPTPASYRNLSVVGGGLLSVPPCTLRHSLYYLDLSHNRISDLSPLQYPNPVPMPYLALLNLNDNNITDLGIFSDMSNLTLLYLAGNRISSLSKLSFNHLPQLSLLDLSRNDFHVVEPGSFKMLYQMQELHLSHNKLTAFSRNVIPMRIYIPDVERDEYRYPYSYQCKIFLDHNRFSHPPFADGGYVPGVDMVVFAANNPYACDCDMKDFLASSNITGHHLGRWEDRASMTCQQPAALRGLPLSDVAFADTCPLVADCPEDCSCVLSKMDGRAHVDCTQAQALSGLLALPAGYPLLVDLQAVNNSAVNSTALTLEDGEYLQRIITLNVSGRGVARVPEFLCEALSNARVLDLSNNHLTRLPDCLRSRSLHWPPLELRLSGNPWACDCDATAFVAWLSGLTGSDDVMNDTQVKVTDARDVRCGGTGMPVAEWDASECTVFDYLPVAAALGSILGLVLVLGPLLYVYRLQAMVALHATLHVRPFTRQYHFREEEFSHEALVVHGPADKGINWVSGTLLPQTDASHHRLCVPERDFLAGASTAESYATAVERAKSIVVLLYSDVIGDEWWLYAFQLARAMNARRPHIKLLLVLMEDIEQERLDQDVREFIKTNTYLRLDDKWFWRKLFYYLPDPPKIGNNA